MALTGFDKYFLNLPPFDRKDDFHDFWNAAIAQARRIPVDPAITKNSRKSSNRFTVYDISYSGFMKTAVTGELLIPRTARGPRVIVHIPDYNTTPSWPQQSLDDSVAYLFTVLRGHANLIKPSPGAEEQSSPGYMIENILDRDTYYVKAVYLDILRSLDMLRLIKEVNCASIGLYGKGFGAAAAVFAAAHYDRVGALVLDTPSFCYLALSQNLSTSDAAREINEFIASSKGKKKVVKDNLTYFDALNFADAITCPVRATVGFKDTVSPPECVFSLFNHILSEKVIEVFPDEGNTAGGDEQFRKSIAWLAEQIA